MLRPLLHWMAYDAGAFPFAPSQANVTVQSVTPVTRRFFGADEDCASAAVELPRAARLNRMATMQVECTARFRKITSSTFRERNRDMARPPVSSRRVTRTAE